MDREKIINTTNGIHELSDDLNQRYNILFPLFCNYFYYRFSSRKVSDETSQGAEAAINSGNVGVKCDRMSH